MNEIKRHKTHGYIIKIFILSIILGINLLVSENIPYFFRIFFIDVLILGLLMAVVLDIREVDVPK
jgi:hypothetical protein